MSGVKEIHMPNVFYLLYSWLYSSIIKCVLLARNGTKMNKYLIIYIYKKSRYFDPWYQKEEKEEREEEKEEEEDIRHKGDAEQGGINSTEDLGRL